MKRLKPSEARKLIGKEVEWETSHDFHRGTCLVEKGVMTEITRNNVLMKDGNYKWLANMINLKEIPKPNQTNETT